MTLDDDASSDKGAVLEGPAEPLEAVLDGLAEPLADQPSEPVTNSRGTRELADTGPDFPKEAWVPADTNLGLPEVCKQDCTVLGRRSENTQVSVLWHSTDMTSFLETTVE